MGSSLLSFFYASLLSVSMHPVHVSVTTIEINTDSSEVMVQVKLFTDDFQRLVSSMYETELKLGTKEEHSEANSYMFGYLNNKLFIELNNKPLELYFFDRKMNEESIWIIMKGKVEKPKKGKYLLRSAAVENSILLDLYDDQSNLVIFNQGNGTEKGYMMNIANLRQEIELQ